MTAFLLPLHIAFGGIWLGCVLTETLFERALLGKGHEQELIFVELHERVDLFVEIPAMVGVAITGALMILSAGVGSLPIAVVAVGVALCANAYCVWLVFRRAAAARADRWDEFARLDHLQHTYGAAVLVAVVLALVIGVALQALGAVAPLLLVVASDGLDKRRAACAVATARTPVGNHPFANLGDIRLPSIGALRVLEHMYAHDDLAYDRPR
jgi:hypothetical protein